MQSIERYELAPHLLSSLDRAGARGTQPPRDPQTLLPTATAAAAAAAAAAAVAAGRAPGQRPTRRA